MKKGDTVFISGGWNKNETGVIVAAGEFYVDVVLDGWNVLSDVSKNQCAVIERNPLTPLPQLCEKFL
jgi:ribosomal protein L24